MLRRAIGAFFLFTFLSTGQQPAEDPGALVTQAQSLLPTARREAEPLLRKAVAIWEKQNATSDEYARALLLLGMTLHPASISNKEALETQVEPLYRKAMELRQKNPDTKPADLALALELEAMVLEQLGRVEDSRDPKSKARALRDQILQVMQGPSDESARTEHLGNPGITPPRLLERAEPALTFEARMLKLQPEVLAEAVIGADGRMRQIEIFRPAGFGLDEQAVQALMQWRFLPAQKAGQPIAVEGTLRLRFH